MNEELLEKKRKQIKLDGSTTLARQKIPKIYPTQQNFERICLISKTFFVNNIMQGCLPGLLKEQASLQIKATYRSLYLMGRYCKYTRNLPQSP